MLGDEPRVLYHQGFWFDVVFNATCFSHVRFYYISLGFNPYRLLLLFNFYSVFVSMNYICSSSNNWF
jgi:hypothetical protein